MRKNAMIGLLLILLGLLLAVLVPGGPVENRDFSHIQPVVLASFNVLLTVLGLGSLWIGIASLYRPIKAGWSVAFALAYIGVYVLDLLMIFPVSPTPMSQALWAIEITGLILAMLLLAVASTGTGEREREVALPVQHASRVLVPVIVLGLGIVVFATCAAMGLCPTDVGH